MNRKYFNTYKEDEIINNDRRATQDVDCNFMCSVLLFKMNKTPDYIILNIWFFKHSPYCQIFCLIDWSGSNIHQLFRAFRGALGFISIWSTLNMRGFIIDHRYNLPFLSGADLIKKDWFKIIRLWVSNYMPNFVWDVITYPHPNFHSHWGRDKMAAILQTIFSNAFLRMEIYEFRLRFHWILFPGVQSTIFQHWFR